MRRPACKVLHLYANHKWTGPADLALLVARATLGRDDPSGGRVEPSFALAGFVHGGMDHAIRARCLELGLPFREGLSLRRHFRVGSTIRDARRLARWIDAGAVDVLHAHQSGDHLVAALALSQARRRVPLVRSVWEVDAPRPWPRALYSFAKTDAVTVPLPGSDAAFARLGIAPRRVFLLPPPLDAAFFAAAADRNVERASLRAELSLDPSALLVGITARIQRRRRWATLWQAWQRVVSREPAAHLVVLGRPDAGVFEELCRDPLGRLGIERHVHFLGYRRGERYRQALLALDLFTMLVPGSDATARALREAMALGIPVVCGDSGRLRAVVGASSVVPLDPARLSAALVDLLADRQRRATLGLRARATARARWMPEVAGAAALTVYGQVRAQAGAAS